MRADCFGAHSGAWDHAGEEFLAILREHAGGETHGDFRQWMPALFEYLKANGDHKGAIETIRVAYQHKRACVEPRPFYESVTAMTDTYLLWKSIVAWAAGDHEGAASAGEWQLSVHAAKAMRGLSTWGTGHRPRALGLLDGAAAERAVAAQRSIAQLAKALEVFSDVTARRGAGARIHHLAALGDMLRAVFPAFLAHVFATTPAALTAQHVAHGGFSGVYIALFVMHETLAGGPLLSQMPESVRQGVAAVHVALDDAVRVEDEGRMCPREAAQFVWLGGYEGSAMQRVQKLRGNVLTESEHTNRGAVRDGKRARINQRKAATQRKRKAALSAAGPGLGSKGSVKGRRTQPPRRAGVGGAESPSERPGSRAAAPSAAKRQHDQGAALSEVDASESHASEQLLALRGATKRMGQAMVVAGHRVLESQLGVIGEDEAMTADALRMFVASALRSLQICDFVARDAGGQSQYQLERKRLRHLGIRDDMLAQCWREEARGLGLAAQEFATPPT